MSEIICNVTGCINPVLKDHDQCHSHHYQCTYTNCQKPRVWENKNYGSLCKEHSCNEYKCANRGITKCNIHLCDLIDCFSERSFKRNYCSNHNCMASGCMNQRIMNMESCNIHNCQIDGCPNVVRSFWSSLTGDAYNNYCHLHKCSVFNCDNMKMNGQNTCDIHVCHVPGCSYPAHNKYHCDAHRCKKFIDCPNHRSSDIEIYCNACLRYCEIENCRNLHAIGDRRCKEEHACICSGGPMRREYCCGYRGARYYYKQPQKIKTPFRCGSQICNNITCKIDEKFIMRYFMLVLNCDMPILEAIHVTNYMHL